MAYVVKFENGDADLYWGEYPGRSVALSIAVEEEWERASMAESHGCKYDQRVPVNARPASKEDQND